MDETWNDTGRPVVGSIDGVGTYRDGQSVRTDREGSLKPYQQTSEVDR